MKIKFIIVSIGRGYGTYAIDKYDCCLKNDLTFDPNFYGAKQFDKKDEALKYLAELQAERKFSRSFYIKEIIVFNP